MKHFILLLSIATFWFQANSATITLTDNSVILQGDTELNKKDEFGRKQGNWVIKGKDRPEKGYPTEGKIEEGPYADNRKNGFWTKYFKDGKTARLIGEFKNGRPKGDYTKMYENGTIREKGTFIDGKQNGTFKTYHANGKIAQEKTFNKNGLEEGVQKYYYPNGQVEFEFIKKNGVTTGKAVRYAEDGQVKEIITYDPTGKVQNREVKEVVIAPKKVIEGAGGPSGASGNMRGKTFERDGYNKVYNDDEELWMDGKFKSGKLFDGKLYKYDSDGILLKIEVWKNGKYHSDGQL
ncbi:MAG: toxin-antitoxin system YwqK family antitoxin [Crocinitomicaceae bacterium]